MGTLCEAGSRRILMYAHIQYAKARTLVRYAAHMKGRCTQTFNVAFWLVDAMATTTPTFIDVAPGTCVRNIRICKIVCAIAQSVPSRFWNVISIGHPVCRLGKICTLFSKGLFYESQLELKSFRFLSLIIKN